MSKYYTLLLNNSKNIGNHYVSPDAFTMLPDVIIRTYNELPSYRKEYASSPSIEEDFAELDDTVITYKDSVSVYGGFPVIGTIIKGDMYDVITGRKIKQTYVTEELSYYKKNIADEGMVELLLSLLTDEDKRRYSDRLDEIESKTIRPSYPYYSLIKPTTMNQSAMPLLVRCDGGNEYYDVVTKEVIVPIHNNTITKKLSFTEKRRVNYSEAGEYSIEYTEAGTEKYIARVEEAKTAAIRNYNNYIRNNGKTYAKRKA